MLKLLVMKFNQKISTKFFIISQILILFSGLIFLGSLYYILYLSYPVLTPFSLGEKLFTQKPKTLLIDLDQPDQDSLTFDPSILISGKTSPNMDILILNDSEDFIVKSKNDGSFSATLDLNEGVNRIIAIVFDVDGQSRSVERSVYYSKEKI